MKKCSTCGYEGEEGICVNCEEPMESKCDNCQEADSNCGCKPKKKENFF